MPRRPSRTFHGQSGEPYAYREYDPDDPSMPHDSANFIIRIINPDGSEELYAGQTDRLYNSLLDHEEYVNATSVYVRTFNTTEKQREDELNDLLDSGGILPLD